MVNSFQVRVMVPNLATPTQAFSVIFIYFNSSFRCLLVRVSGNMKKRGHAVAGRAWPAFHFHSVILIFVNLWPISTLCVANMVHAVADMVVADIIVSQSH